MCRGSPLPTSSVAKSRRKSRGERDRLPRVYDACGGGGLVEKGVAEHLLVRVVAHRQGNRAVATLVASLYLQQNFDKIWTLRDEAFLVGLRRDDVQQGHDRVRRGRDVVPQ